MNQLRETLMRSPRNDAPDLAQKDFSTPSHDSVEAGGEAVSRGGLPLAKGAGLGTSRAADPERTCVLTRIHGSRGALIRLALAPDGHVHPDVRAKAPGRGAWIGVDKAALNTALAKGKLKGALSRAFKSGDIVVPDDLPQRIEDALSRAALERLGLEARASTLVTGTDRIEDHARKGVLEMLFHAADASTDGNRKLAQAWRVGRGEEGSGRQGLVLAADRTILSIALGRENVVHIGVIDARAAARVAAVIDRWHGFIGLASTGWPCEIPSQGSGPRGAYEA
jgi:uncharacterized protein